eukprot:6775995-Lingulodinium_polyedra.AAC.1
MHGVMLSWACQQRVVCRVEFVVGVPGMVSVFICLLGRGIGSNIRVNGDRCVRGHGKLYG